MSAEIVNKVRTGRFRFSVRYEGRTEIWTAPEGYGWAAAADWAQCEARRRGWRGARIGTAGKEG